MRSRYEAGDRLTAEMLYLKNLHASYVHTLRSASGDLPSPATLE